MTRSGAVNALAGDKLFFIGIGRCLNDMDVFRHCGLAHGRESHSRVAPSDDRWCIGWLGGPSAAMRPYADSGSGTESMRTRVTPSTRKPHHGHGLRASLAFEPLQACPSLQAGQRRADHDRGETCECASRPRGRTVRRSPARSATTAARISAQSSRGSKFRPMEDGRAATLTRFGRRSGAKPRRPQPRRHGTLRSWSGRPRACRPPGCQ